MNIVQVIKNSQQFIWFTVDPNGMIKDCNIGFEKLFQYRKGEMNIDKFIPSWKQYLSKLPAYNYYVLNDNLICNGLNLHTDKHEDDYEFFGEMPMYNNQAHLNAMTDMNQELTNLTREINRKNVRLETLVLKLKQTQMQIIQDERMVGLGRIAAGIAHEVNNPLGIVISNVDYMYEMLSDITHAIPNDVLSSSQDLRLSIAEISEIGVELRSALNRIKEIVGAFRDYSDLDRLDDWYSFNIKSGIESTLLLLSSQLTDIAVDINVSNRLSLDAKGAELNQVFNHILENAVLAVEQSNKLTKTIGIKASEDGGFITMIFEDNGVGMNDEMIKHAFDPFYTSRDVGKGKGIGLSICYETIVNKYNGRIRIESELSKGTQIIIKIPKERKHA